MDYYIKSGKLHKKKDVFITLNLILILINIIIIIKQFSCCFTGHSQMVTAHSLGE